MSFSRLLFVAANSRKQIVGKRNDKVVISPNNSIARRDPFQGEVILCFQLDDPNDQEKRVQHSLGIADDGQRCDGLVFYSKDEQPYRVICLVEMKSKNIKEAADQITSTKRHLKMLLDKECYALDDNYRANALKQITSIKWKAALYHFGGSPDNEVEKILLELKKSYGFAEADHFTHAKNDLRPLLTDEDRGAKDLARQIRQKHSKRR